MVINIVILFLLSGNTIKAENHTFTITNQTITPIIQLFVFDKVEKKWKEDILNNVFIGMFSEGVINYNSKPKDCFFNLKAVFDGGDSVERNDFNVCKPDVWIIRKYE